MQNINKGFEKEKTTSQTNRKQSVIYIHTLESVGHCMRLQSPHATQTLDKHQSHKRAL